MYSLGLLLHSVVETLAMQLLHLFGLRDEGEELESYAAAYGSSAVRTDRSMTS